jgi:hypothetical protein
MEKPLMNKRQAQRIALAVNASYLLFGASTDAITDHLSDADVRRYEDAQKELARAMLCRAGFEEPLHADRILAAVLGDDLKNAATSVPS